MMQKLDADGKRLGAEMTGKTFQVLAEGPARHGDGFQGRASNNRPVVFSGPAQSGEFYDVKITATAPAGRALLGERPS